MCQRYSLKDLATAVAIFYDQLAEAAEDWTPRYNVALTQKMPVVTRRAGRTKLETLGFGLVPPPPPPRRWLQGREKTGRPPPAALFHAEGRRPVLLRRALGARTRRPAGCIL